MAEQKPVVDRIDSWKDISEYLGRDIRTAIRWEKEKGLPVRRVPGGQRQAVFAYRHEIDAWLNSSIPANKEAAPLNADPVGASVPAVYPVIEADSQISRLATAQRRRRAVWAAIAVAASLLFCFVSYRYVEGARSLPAIQLTDLQQLTENGREKDHLLISGSNLYFGQEQDGWFGLASISTVGGPVRTLWNPPMNVFPETIAPDGSRLLALTFLGIEGERSIWIVPLDGGTPRPLGNLTAHSAAWSPDGQSIAYATGNKICEVSSDGTGVREIASFGEIPDILRWSADGRHLRFLLLDIATRKPTYWELSLPDRTKPAALRSLPFAIGKPGDRWSNTTDGDETIAFDGGSKGDSGWLIQHGVKWWNSPVKLAELHTSPGGIRGVAISPSADRIYLLNLSPARRVLLRYDQKTEEFRTILPGISSVFMDYSRDAHWITYVRPGEQTLWISHADGTGAKQITTPSMGSVELPRWSPDGNWIAYMMKRPDSIWRVFITPRDGGRTREASEGNDNQGAPTWSPDGKYLVYGNVECLTMHTCEVHRIEVSTGRVQTVPGSEGLATARWSPDGRYIAALQPERHQLFIFDVERSKWQKLADSMAGTDLSWSTDSKYLYMDLPGSEASIVRIDVASGTVKRVLDLRGQDDLNLAEVSDMEFSLAPDNSIILPRKMSAAEIYSYAIHR